MDVVSYVNELVVYSLFGNPVYEYFLFVLILVLYWPVSKFAKMFVDKFLMQWAERTKWELDDCLVRSLNPSISMFVFTGCFYFAGVLIGFDRFAVFTKILNFLLIIPIVYFMIKFSTEAVGYYLKAGKGKKNEAAIDLLLSILKIALVVVGVLLILANLGYDVSALLAGLGVGGLAFALAAQDILKNFFSGITLIFDDTFKKGERVNFAGFSGIIEQVKLRSTKVRTYDGTLLTIPNSSLSDDVVENVTKVPVVKVKMDLGLVYGLSSKKILEAKEIVKRVLKENEFVDEERTSVYFDSFGDFALILKVIYFAKTLTMDDWDERIAMKEEVNLGIMEGFESAGIDFAFPTQTIELIKK